MNIALPFDWSEASPAPVRVGTSWTRLPPAEQLLLWSMRHMLVCWPSCSSVKSALHSVYDEKALGVEHLLRCLLTGIGALSARSLSIGDPTCALVLGDEAAILDALRTCSRDPDVAISTLVEVCAEPRAASLLPLVVSLAEAAGLSDLA